MKNNFSDKLNDFAEWTKTAFTHFNNGFYADSLTNMRKSGEAACKIIFLHKFSEKISENKIGQKSYKELIELIIKDNLAPRKVINWLETLQIHGNEATHDTRIMQEQSYYGIIALRLLIYWLYIEFLKSTVPTALQNEISQIKEKSVDLINSKKVEEERSKLINEKEELEKKLNLLKGKENQENEKIKNLTNELNNSVTKIKELDTAQQKITELEKQLSRYKTEAEELKSKQTILEPPKKKNNSKLIAVSALSLVIIIVGFFIFKTILSNFNNTANEKANAEILKQQADSFMVLVFPFAVLQDNPNIKINFEEALINHIRQKAQSIKLPLKIIYKSEFSKSALTKSNILDEGIKEKALVVLYGELYEPLNNDSSQVNIKNILIRKDKPFYSESGIKTFNRLTDTSAIKIIQSVECIINFTIAEYYVNNNKYSEALALLYNTVPIEKYQKMYYCDFLVQCHMTNKNYYAAVKEMERYIKLYPDTAHPYVYLGDIYSKMKDFNKAAYNYEKALKIQPNHIAALLKYSDLLMTASVKNHKYAKSLLIEAIRLDSTNYSSWLHLAELENQVKDYKSAKKHYIKALSIKPDHIYAKRNLANILAFQLNEPEKAVEYLSSNLLKDSNDLQTLFLLGNIYTSSRIKNPSKAEYFLKKCKSISNEPGAFETDKGLGMAAMDKKDYKTALTCFLKAWSLNKNDFLVCDYLSEIYFNSKDYANAEIFLQKAYKLDSMNYRINYSAGFFYLFAEGKFANQKKAEYYFEKELKTNPYDTLALQYLYTIYFDQKNITKMKELCNRINSLTPNSFFVHKAFGYLAELEGNNEKAISHYKKAIEIIQQDDECNYKIAWLLMNQNPKKHWKEAMQYAEIAISINPKSAECNFVYSQVLMFSGDFRKGSEYYFKSVELNPSFRDTALDNSLKKKGY